MSAHTPTPWRISAHGAILTPSGKRLLLNGVSMTLGNHPCEAEADANAALIVRAVNSHAALLEACQAAEHWLTEEAANPGEATPDEILRVLRAAIGNADASAATPATDYKSAASELFTALQSLTPDAELGDVDLDDEDAERLEAAREVLRKWEGKLTHPNKSPNV